MPPANVTAAPLPAPLRWPVDLLLDAVETASWVYARALRADANHFLGDIGTKVALGSGIEESLIAAGHAIIRLSEVLDGAPVGGPDSPEVSGMRQEAIGAVQELAKVLLTAQPSERAKALRISWLVRERTELVTRTLERS
jgi:hypothetical protein